MKQITFFCFWMITSFVHAQSFDLKIEGANEESEDYISENHYKSEFKDSSNASNSFIKYLNLLSSKGYCAYSYEETIPFHYQLNIGPRFKFNHLDPGNVDRFVLGEIGWLESDFEEPISLKRTQNLITDLLSYFENNGYPFVRINMKNIQISYDSIQAELFINPGELRTLDSIITKGGIKIPYGFTRYFLGLKKQQVYNEKKYQDLNDEIEKSGIFQMPRPPQFLFENQRTTLFLYLDKRPVNRISGIAGLNTNDDGSVFFTGNLDLSLSHVFNAAESFDLKWSSPRSGSQQLNVNLDIPYLFKSPFGIVSSFDLYREDTIFSNRNAQIGISLKPNSKSGLSISYLDKRSTNLQGSSDLANVNTKYWILNTFYSTLNHHYLPTKGLRTEIGFGQGQRKTAEIDQTQYSALISFQYFKTLFKNHKFYAGIKSEGLFNTDLVTNELFRIGGVKSIRGFNEQSIFTSAYAFSQMEYRYFLERMTYAFVFSDIGFVQNKVLTENQESWLTGLGAGFSFFSNGGIFSISFAVGKQDNLPFDFRNTKVHLGYINQF